MTGPVEPHLSVGPGSARVAVIGPEKTGTHLAARLLSLLGMRNSKNSTSRFIADRPDATFGLSAAEFASDPQRVRLWGWPLDGTPRSLVRDWLDGMPKGHFSHNHAPYSDELASIFLELDYRLVLTIRDPRDQAVSLARWFADPASPDNLRRKELGPLPFEERLSIAITGHRLSSGAMVEGVSRRYEVMEGWRELPSTTIIRFEDIVGGKGGGSDETQLAVVRAVADAVAVPLKTKKANKIAASLFGTSTTFRSGQIGGWRTVFTPEHRELFDRAAGGVAERFGYG